MKTNFRSIALILILTVAIVLLHATYNLPLTLEGVILGIPVALLFAIIIIKSKKYKRLTSYIFGFTLLLVSLVLREKVINHIWSFGIAFLWSSLFFEYILGSKRIKNNKEIVQLSERG